MNQYDPTENNVENAEPKNQPMKKNEEIKKKKKKKDHVKIFTRCDIVGHSWYEMERTKPFSLLKQAHLKRLTDEQRENNLFYFLINGDYLGDDDTPASLNIEEDDEIDILFRNRRPNNTVRIVILIYQSSRCAFPVSPAAPNWVV